MAEINISFDISGLHTYRVSFIVSGCPWVQNMILPGRVLSNINTAVNWPEVTQYNKTLNGSKIQIKKS